MARNRELFEKVADRIEASPRLYNQDDWVVERECGTAYCIGGWAVKLDPAFEIRWSVVYRTHVCRVSDDEFVAFPDAAAEALSITSREAEILFHGDWMDEEPVSAVADALRAIGRGEGDPLDFSDPERYYA